eukprot:5995105-Pyramimonas_sp.AAC.1
MRSTTTQGAGGLEASAGAAAGCRGAGNGGGETSRTFSSEAASAVEALCSCLSTESSSPIVAAMAPSFCTPSPTSGNRSCRVGCPVPAGGALECTILENSSSKL